MPTRDTWAWVSFQKVILQYSVLFSDHICRSQLIWGLQPLGPNTCWLHIFEMKSTWDTRPDVVFLENLLLSAVRNQHWHLARFKFFFWSWSIFSSAVRWLQILFISWYCIRDRKWIVFRECRDFGFYFYLCSVCLLFRDKSKKLAEQAAAIVCLRTLGVPEGKLCEGENHLINKRKREDLEHLNNRDHGKDLAEPSHKKANFTEETSDMNVPQMPR